MGLLEQMMAKLDYLTSLVEGKGDIAVAIHDGQVKEVFVPADKPVLEQTTTELPGEGIELDKNGIPWDERIHAGTKRKNADGTWSLKKGVDKELAAQIIAEYQSGRETETETTTAPSKPAAPAAPSAKTPPAPPSKPGVPAAPSAPAKPGVPSAPKAEDAGPTVKAARLSNVLINDMGVDYDLVIAGVLTPRGYDQFGSVTSEDAEGVLKDLEKWEEKLKDLVEEFAGLRSMAEGTEHTQAVEDGLAYYVSDNGGEGDNPATIPFNKLHDAYVEVAKWSNEWEPVLAALKG